jgi:hypothetical protein
VTAADVLRAELAAPPRPPVDPDRFSSNVLFGEPGIYPQGSPMIPASGEAPDESAAVAALEAVGVADAVALMTHAELRRRAPHPGPRAGLVALTVTVGAPMFEAFLAGATPVRSLGSGVPASPGRIVGPTAGGDPADRVVNERYRAEHPALLAGSLVHDLLWSGEGAQQYEEVTLHALCALVHAQLLARAPFLAISGTELARRQNSLAVTLLNSRHPGSAELSVRAPDGPGTIPGGAAQMQTPDFWSIPFVGGPPVATDAPPSLGTVLRLVVGGEPPPPPLRYDDALGVWWSERGMRGALSLDAQWRASCALGLTIDPLTT